MTRKRFPIPLICLLVVAAAAPAPAPAASPEPVAAANDELVAFLPSPERVFLQKSDLLRGFGNAVVFAHLTDEQVTALQAETGRRDFAVIGTEGGQTILRDDGRGVDAVAGDGEFTGVVTVDEAELEARAAEDSANAGETTSVPVFQNRVLTGEEAVQPFDAAGFAAGQKVELTVPVEGLSTESSTATVKLVRSTGELQPLPAASHGNAFQDKVLMITDPAVVQDPSRTFDPCTGGNPNGVWTFKHLITEMANPAASGIDPAVFAEQWLNHWLSNQTINGFGVPARPSMGAILGSWPRKPDGTLDLDQSPLRLLAIVSRLDLATVRGGGSGYGTRQGDFLDAGEARFVFGVLDGCSPAPFSVIFEYRVPRCTCTAVRSWARQWVALRGLTLGSPTYNARLERLTEQFVRADADPTRPNGSALGQLRTNEIHLQFPWELREFQLDQKPFSFLREKTTADTMHDGFNGAAGFADWVRNAVVPGLPNAVPKVPLFFAPHGNFLGANPQPPNPGFFWDEASLAACVPPERDGRFTASLNTCNGCHAGETATPFVHVDPSTPLGVPAGLSGFLTGITVNDPGVAARACGPFSRTFDDLDRRELDIRRKARMTCFRAHRVAVAAIRSSLAQTGTLPDDLFAGLSPEPPEHQLPVTFEPLLTDPVTQVH